MKRKSKRFRLPADCRPEQLEDALAMQWPSKADAPVVETWRIFDTFDRRLWAASEALLWSGETLVLCSLPTGDTILECPMATAPRFAGEMSEGECRARLAAIIKMRALIELAALQIRTSTCWIQNENGKLVSRAVFVIGSVETKGDSTKHACCVTVEPFRGYAKDNRRLLETLLRSLPILPTNEGIQLWAVQTAGLGCAGYSNKVDVQLQPAMPAATSTKHILRRLLETMQANEAGIKADIDTEFLHDFRVAVRRTRSALSQIRKVFSPEATSYFKQEFRALGQLTNELRDLDVYLLAERDYQFMLPDYLRDDVTPLFDHLRARRVEVHAQVVSGLESGWYAQLLEAWDAFLAESPAEENGVHGARPIIDVACRRLSRQYRKVVVDGTDILVHTEDALLHDLRIECKKLRYLLEFFASLFPPKEIRRQVKHLKRLQNNLGTFNDLDVQQTTLLEIAGELEIEKAGTRRTLVAIGALVEKMAREQDAVKANFAATFTRFASPKHQKRFRRLIAGGK